MGVVGTTPRVSGADPGGALVVVVVSGKRGLKAPTRAVMERLDAPVVASFANLWDRPFATYPSARGDRRHMVGFFMGFPISPEACIAAKDTSLDAMLYAEGAALAANPWAARCLAGGN